MSQINELTTPELRKSIGAIMRELRARAALTHERETDPTEEALKVAEKTAHVPAPRQPKVERNFGIKCVSTGKILKRKFADRTDADKDAAELTVSMKREYVSFAL